MTTATKALATSAELLANSEFDLILSDEINIALRYDYLKVADVIAAQDQRPKPLSCRDHGPAGH